VLGSKLENGDAGSVAYRFRVVGAALIDDEHDIRRYTQCWKSAVEEMATVYGWDGNQRFAQGPVNHEKVKLV
jgi:hypothetical protein